MSGDLLLPPPREPSLAPPPPLATSGPVLPTRSASSTEAGAIPQDHLAERLMRSLRFSTAGAAVGITGMALIYTFVVSSPWILVMLVLSALYQIVHVWLRRQCRRGRVTTAALWCCAGDWLLSLLALIIVPVFAVALVPHVIGRLISTMPYLDRRALKRLLLVALAVAATVGALSQVDFVGLDDALPLWVLVPFVAALLTLGVGNVVLDLWQNSATLHETAHRALEANVTLRASQSALAHQAEELRRSRARVLAAADDERRRVERDLHDGVQQTLTALCLNVSVLRQRQPQDSPLRDELAKLEDLAQETMTELRDVAHGIYPPVLASQGLGPALAAVARRTRVPVRAELAPVRRRAPDLEAAVYFCVREALQNVEKHAGSGAAAELTLLEGDDGALHFSVTDSGRGFEPGRGYGHGLTNMRDRVSAVGGALSLESRPGAGVRLDGCVPAPPTGNSEPSAVRWDCNSVA